MNMKNILFILTFLVMSTVANAEIKREYLGITLGQGMIDPGDDSSIQNDDLESSLSYGVFGTRITESGFGVELGIVAFDEFQSEDFDNVYARAYGFEVSPLYEMALSETVALYGKAGLFAWTASYTTDTARWEDSGVSVTLGLGVTLLPKASNLIWRFGAQYYNDVDDAGITRAGVDLGFHF